MTVYNGVLVIRFSAAMLLTAMSFTGNLVTGFPTVFTVDLCRVKVLTHLSLLLVFIWLGGVRGREQGQEFTYFYPTVEELPNFLFPT